MPQPVGTRHDHSEGPLPASGGVEALGSCATIPSGTSEPKKQHLDPPRAQDCGTQPAGSKAQRQSPNPAPGKAEGWFAAPWHCSVPNWLLMPPQPTGKGAGIRQVRSALQEKPQTSPAHSPPRQGSIPPHPSGQGEPNSPSIGTGRAPHPIYRDRESPTCRPSGHQQPPQHQ